MRIHARQIDAEQRAAQRHDELTVKRAALNSQLTKLHRHEAMLEMERATPIDFTMAWAWAGAIVATINCEGSPHLTFTRASQNVATVAVLLDTLHIPFTDGVDKVYHRLKDILGIAAM
jgi:hypothetical protein